MHFTFFDIIFQIARQHFPFHPMEHLVHKAWKAHKSLHSHVKSMFFLIGMACTHFLAHCLWLKYIWTCMTCQPSILACFRFSYVFVFACCGFNLRKFKKEYSWYGLHFSFWLPLYSLYQQKSSLSNRAFITLLSHMGYQVQFFHNSTLKILPKRSMRTKSLPFRITFSHWTQSLFRVIRRHNNFP